MQKKTQRQVEDVLKRFAKQLKDQDTSISVNQAQALARLTSSYYRLIRQSEPQGGNVDPMESGDPSFYDSLTGD